MSRQTVRALFFCCVVLCQLPVQSGYCQTKQKGRKQAGPDADWSASVLANDSTAIAYLRSHPGTVHDQDILQLLLPHGKASMDFALDGGLVQSMKGNRGSVNVWVHQLGDGVAEIGSAYGKYSAYDPMPPATPFKPATSSAPRNQNTGGLVSLTWAAGATHTIAGSLVILGYCIVSDMANPLVFKTIEDKGYVYQSGLGIVVNPANDITVIGRGGELHFASTAGNDLVASGLAKENKRDFEGAIADFTKAIQLKPDSAEAFCSRGLAKLELGTFSPQHKDLSSAITDLTEAVRLKPDYAEAYHFRGNARRQDGDLDGAIADFTKAIQLKPDYSIAYYARGGTRVLKGDTDGAIADYTAAIGLKSSAEAYYSRGNARELKGDTDGAIADYSAAIGLKPTPFTGARAYVGRAKAKEAKGDSVGAIADYAMAKDLSKGQPFSISTPEPNHAAAPATTAFIPMPQDISCAFQTITAAQRDPTEAPVVYSLGGINCQTTTPAGAYKKIALASSMPKDGIGSSILKDGILTTQDFGEFRITAKGSSGSQPYPLAVELHPSQLAALRAFLSR